MKSFKTLADATRRAAESGATLDIGGRMVNAAGARLSVVSQRHEPVAQSGQSSPDLVARLVEVVAAQSQGVTMMVAEVLERLVAQQGPAQTQAVEPAPAQQGAMSAMSAMQAVAPTDAPSSMPVEFAVTWVNGAPRLEPTYGAAAGRPVAFDFIKDDSGQTIKVVPVYETTA